MIAALVAAAWTTASPADWTDARCDIYPKGSDHTDKMIPCTFGQRQGYITITRDDGVTHDLSPVGEDSGNYRDQRGRPAKREDDLGPAGLIFRFQDESVYVYWSTSALNPSEEDNPAAPFSTKDYDATALLRCRAAGDQAFGDCPAGAQRMEGGEASVTIQSPSGERFTVNFMKTYINAANRKVDASLDGDTWIVPSTARKPTRCPSPSSKGAEWPVTHFRVVPSKINQEV